MEDPELLAPGARLRLTSDGNEKDRAVASRSRAVPWSADGVTYAWYNVVSSLSRVTLNQRAALQGLAATLGLVVVGLIFQKSWEWFLAAAAVGVVMALALSLLIRLQGK